MFSKTFDDLEVLIKKHQKEVSRHSENIRISMESLKQTSTNNTRQGTEEIFDRFKLDDL